jgi:hypothetical protein
MSGKEKAAMAIISILLLADEKNESNKNTRTIDVKNLYKRRQEKGSYESLIKELALKDSENYRRYLRKYRRYFYWFFISRSSHKVEISSTPFQATSDVS